MGGVRGWEDDVEGRMEENGGWEVMGSEEDGRRRRK